MNTHCTYTKPHFWELSPALALTYSAVTLGFHWVQEELWCFGKYYRYELSIAASAQRTKVSRVWFLSKLNKFHWAKPAKKNHFSKDRVKKDPLEVLVNSVESSAIHRGKLIQRNSSRCIQEEILLSRTYSKLYGCVASPFSR